MTKSELETLIRLIAKRGNGPTQPTPLDVGWVGRLFGARYADTNITGLVIVALLVLLFVVWLRPEYAESRELITGSASSIIGLALGYMFGKYRP